MTLTTEDKAEIGELCAAFCALLDEEQFVEVSKLFCEDALLHRADGSTVNGRDQILAAQSSRPAGVRAVHHSSPVHIEPLSPDRARGRSSFVSVAVDAHGEAAAWVIGVFEDRYRREDVRWMFSERRITPVHRR